jgi:hypothetical protein
MLQVDARRPDIQVRTLTVQLVRIGFAGDANPVCI